MVVLRFAVDDEPSFLADAPAALEALAGRPGYRRGHLGRAVDEPSQWCLLTEWESVGAYRRALGAYEVKLHATPLLARALPVASAFEPLLSAEPGQAAVAASSDASGIATGR